MPSKHLFPQSCVSSGCSMLGLMATSCKRTYAIPAPRASVLAADHRQPVRPQETLKHSSVSVSVGSLGPGAHKVCLSPLSISGRSRFNSKHEFAPPTVLLGLRLCPCAWGISSQPLQCLPSYWGFSDLERGVSPLRRSLLQNHAELGLACALTYTCKYFIQISHKITRQKMHSALECFKWW